MKRFETRDLHSFFVRLSDDECSYRKGTELLFRFL
jgi:hypothetical protein